MPNNIQNSNTKLSINVTVRSREKVVFEGEAIAFTSVNQKGIFDVLAQHENFISIIKDVLVVHREKDKKEEFKVERGVIKVRENKVHVYLVA